MRAVKWCFSQPKRSILWNLAESTSKKKKKKVNSFLFLFLIIIIRYINIKRQQQYKLYCINNNITMATVVKNEVTVVVTVVLTVAVAMTVAAENEEIDKAQ